MIPIFQQLNGKHGNLRGGSGFPVQGQDPGPGQFFDSKGGQLFQHHIHGHFITGHFKDEMFLSFVQEPALKTGDDLFDLCPVRRWRFDTDQGHFPLDRFLAGLAVGAPQMVSIL
jgi:hypothetical protein